MRGSVSLTRGVGWAGRGEWVSESKTEWERERASEKKQRIRQKGRSWGWFGSSQKKRGGWNIFSEVVVWWWCVGEGKERERERCCIAAETVFIYRFFTATFPTRFSIYLIPSSSTPPPSSPSSRNPFSFHSTYTSLAFLSPLPVRPGRVRLVRCSLFSFGIRTHSLTPNDGRFWVFIYA